MWETTVDGRPLNFHLSGINNQNFLMRDEETGSWWQQVSGECILGPLKGRRLNGMFHDELTFAAWRRERPQGRVLRPDKAIAEAGQYAPTDWEEKVGRMPVATAATTTRAPAEDPFEARTLVVGVTVAGGASKAYPLAALQRQSPIVDTVGGMPVVLVLNDDRKSVRAFDRTVDGRPLEFFAKSGASPLRLVDAETGSEWDFTGTALGGALAGRQLQKIAVLNDYWFDWKTYHPDTDVYLLGER